MNDSQSLTPEQLAKNEEKRVKCIYCKQPIHVSKFGGIKKEGLFCNETLCIMQLIIEHEDTNCTKDEEVKG